jgi:5'-nucleotidase/UDP-sugar diphosphatase
MKRVLASLVVVALSSVVGCSGNGSKPAAQTGVGPSSSVLDISPTPPLAASYSQTPVAPQPVTVEPAPAPPVVPETLTVTSTATPASGTIAAAGGKYKVKKGDTLYGIARTTYGDGKQWQRIASANPGLSPTSLKVGQVIVVP